jgi:hypothetical protein
MHKQHSQTAAVQPSSCGSFQRWTCHNRRTIRVVVAALPMHVAGVGLAWPPRS